MKGGNDRDKRKSKKGTKEGMEVRCRQEGERERKNEPLGTGNEHVYIFTECLRVSNLQ